MGKTFHIYLFLQSRHVLESVLPLPKSSIFVHIPDKKKKKHTWSFSSSRLQRLAKISRVVTRIHNFQLQTVYKRAYKQTRKREKKKTRMWSSAAREVYEWGRGSLTSGTCQEARRGKIRPRRRRRRRRFPAVVFCPSGRPSPPLPCPHEFSEPRASRRNSNRRPGSLCRRNCSPVQLVSQHRPHHAESQWQSVVHTPGWSAGGGGGGRSSTSTRQRHVCRVSIRTALPDELTTHASLARDVFARETKRARPRSLSLSLSLSRLFRFSSSTLCANNPRPRAGNCYRTSTFRRHDRYVGGTIVKYFDRRRVFSLLSVNRCLSSSPRDHRSKSIRLGERGDRN